MKECIFLLVLGQLKTSLVFSYTWSSTCATYTNSQHSCILNAQKMWKCDLSRFLCLHQCASKQGTTWEQLSNASRYGVLISIHNFLWTLLCCRVHDIMIWEDYLHVAKLTGDHGQYTKMAFKYFPMLQIVCDINDRKGWMTLNPYITMCQTAAIARFRWME